MSQTLDRMSTLDAEFFYAEHHNVPMHIGSVAVFDGPAPTRADLMRLFEAKLPLDRHRPLWEEWLLDGLEGGRWAILSKIHHCMVDGIGGNELMTLVFDTAPDERVPEAAPWVPGPRPSLAELAAGD